jgi:pilus assembly protein CpaC
MNRTGAEQIRNLIFNGILAALVAMMAMVGAPVAASAEESVRQVTLEDGDIDRFVLAPGFVVTVTTDKPFVDLVVGNTAVADVYPLTNTSIYIQAKSSGFTNVAIYGENKKPLGVFDIRVQLDFSELQSAIDSAVPTSHVKVSNVNNRIRLTGEVRDNVDEQRAMEIASQYSDEPVINAMRVKSGQQVQLDVRILEVARNAGRELGIDLNFNSGIVSFDGGAATPSAGSSKLELNGAVVDLVINALEAKGLARRLANPTLITTSGIKADFNVGGEIPIKEVVYGRDGQPQEQTGYREYGVKLSFRPTVLDDGLIQLEISPEVSRPDETAYVEGTGFITRTVDTTVSLRDGQSFAIAGLLDVTNERKLAQVPWLGQIPVLGALFRSAEFQKRETELVILVTPHMVRPAAPDEPLHSPLDNTRSSNDAELFLLGMLEVDKDLIRSFEQGAGVVGPYGHMIDLEFNDGPVQK